MSTLRHMPIGERILVRPIPPAPHPSGMTLPASTLGDTIEAEIIAIGAKVEATLSNGQRLTLPKKAGVPLKLDGEDFKVITERDILVATVLLTV